MLADTREWRVVWLAAIPATLAWLAVVASRIGGDYDYFMPLALAGAVAVTLILSSASSRGRTALLFLLIVVLTLLNYRVRGFPENQDDGRIWQNALKLAVWGCLLVPCLINLRVIMTYMVDPAVSLFLVFIAMSMASAAWSVDPLMTVLSAVGLLAYLMFGCLLASVLPPRTLTLTLVWSLAVYCVVNWIWTAVSPEVGLLDTGGIGAFLRLQGISGHPNFLGGQAAIMICLLIAAYERSYIGRVWFYLIGCIGIITMIATQSRTASVGLILSIAACYFRRQFFLVALICIGGLTMAVMTGYFDELTSLFVRQGDGDALAGRGDIWDYLGQKVADRPWFGYGYNIFERYYEVDHPNILNPASPLAGAPIPSHPHNSYLEVLFSGGIITLLPYVAWTVLIIKRWLMQPDNLRDLVLMWLIFGSMTEVGLAGPPSMQILISFVLIGISQPVRARNYGSTGISYAY